MSIVAIATIAPTERQVAALLLAIMLLALVVLAILVVLRTGRTMKRRHLERPAEPTASSDVWQMHKLPDDADDDGAPQKGDITDFQ